MFSTNSIIYELATCLDEMEGDFTQKQLFDALKKLKEYPYVCDKTIKDKKWQKFINEEK